MPDIGIALRDEVSRLAKRANKRELQALRRAASESRRRIAALKRELEAVQRALKNLSSPRGERPQLQRNPDGPRLRFSAKGFAKKRQQLGLSAASMGKLLGVSALSVYNWESGKAKPRQKQLQAIASVRAMGKREAAAKLGQD